MNKRALGLLFLGSAFLLAAPGVPTAGTIPPEVAERFKAAEMLGQDDDFVGSFIFTTNTVIQKPNGKGRQEEMMEIAVTRSKDGTVTGHLIRLLEDGKDVTEKRRQKIEKKFAEDGKDSDDEEDEDLISPFGETASKYSFSETKNQGAAALISFEPKPEFLDEEGMARGTVSWHRETLDPLWIEMTALTAPKPLKELTLRMEFARQDGAMYMNRLLSSGTAKVLLFTREFEADIRVSEVKPEPPTPK